MLYSKVNDMDKHMLHIQNAYYRKVKRVCINVTIVQMAHSDDFYFLIYFSPKISMYCLQLRKLKVVTTQTIHKLVPTVTAKT